MANPVNSKWRITAIVLAFVTLVLGVESFRVKSALNNVFHYDVRVTVKDRNTGEILKGLTTHGPGSSSDDIFHQSATFVGGVENWQISGVAYEPRVIGFSADGYQRGELVISNGMKGAITLELEAKE